MSGGLFAAMMLAAFLHAAWNAVIKTGGSRLGMMLAVSLAEVAIGAAAVLLLPPVAPEAWPWIVAASCTHLAYKSFLTFAYERGDLSRVYPIARGTAPMLVALWGAFVLAEPVTGHEYAGIAILGVGIALMAWGALAAAENRRLLPFAFGSALATATYTVIDGLGARVSGSAVAYVGWIFIGGGLLYSAVMLAWRGRRVLPATGRDWALGGGGALGSWAAYGISIWAMTRAPIPLVAALRETSILFAVLIGWWVFGERLDRGKMIAAALIVAGVVATRL